MTKLILAALLSLPLASAAQAVFHIDTAYVCPTLRTAKNLGANPEGTCKLAIDKTVVAYTNTDAEILRVKSLHRNTLFVWVYRKDCTPID